MFSFVPSKEMKVSVFKNQEKQIMSKEKIAQKMCGDNVFAYDIFLKDELVGFAMFRKNKNNLFLWNYAIDQKFQNKKYGQTALKELILFLQNKEKIKNFTTTYKIGNNKAKKVYEKLGFKETEIIDEENIKEVNMELKL